MDAAAIVALYTDAPWPPQISPLDRPTQGLLHCFSSKSVALLITSKVPQLHVLPAKVPAMGKPLARQVELHMAEDMSEDA